MILLTDFTNGLEYFVVAIITCEEKSAIYTYKETKIQKLGSI